MHRTFRNRRRVAHIRQKVNWIFFQSQFRAVYLNLIYLKWFYPKMQVLRRRVRGKLVCRVFFNYRYKVLIWITLLKVNQHHQHHRQALLPHVALKPIQLMSMISRNLYTALGRRFWMIEMPFRFRTNVTSIVCTIYLSRPVVNLAIFSVVHFSKHNHHPKEDCLCC